MEIFLFGIYCVLTTICYTVKERRVNTDSRKSRSCSVTGSRLRAQSGSLRLSYGGIGADGVNSGTSIISFTQYTTAQIGVAVRNARYTRRCCVYVRNFSFPM